MAAVLAAATVAVAQGQATTEDRGPVLSTVDEIRAAGEAGGVYTLAADNFLLDEPLVVTSDLTLWGQGHQETALRVRKASVGIVITNGANMRIAGVHLDGVVSGTVSADGSRDSGAGLDLIQVQNGTLEMIGSRLSRARGAVDSDTAYGRGCALVIDGSSAARVANSSFESNQLCAVRLSDLARFELSGSYVYGNFNGVLAEGDSQLALKDNIFEATELLAIIVRGSAAANIEDNTIVSNGATLDTAEEAADATRFGGNATIALSGNRFLNNPRFALALHGDVVVTSVDNYFEGNGGISAVTHESFSAMSLAERARVNSTGDVFFTNPAGAIDLTDDAHLEMTNTEVRGNGSYSSMFVGANTSAVVTEANFTDNEGSILVTDAASLTVVGGTFLTSTAAAISVDGSGNLELTGATLAKNQGAAIGLGEDATGTIAGAVFERNGAGVVFNDRAQGNVTGSRFDSNRDNAIAYQGKSGGTATDNDIRHVPGQAIYVANEAVADVNGNRVTDAAD